MRTGYPRLVTVAAAVVLGATTLGCGFISTAKQAVDNVSAVGDLTDRLGKSAGLTYTAEYHLADGTGTATVVQQPPNAAFTGPAGRFVLTAEALTMCTGAGKKAVCQRSPNATGGTAGADHAAYMTAVAGGGFVSTPMALALLTATSIVPGVRIDASERTVAGLAGTCLRASGIPQDADPNSVEAQEYTVCVADNGVLTAFTGTGSDGRTIGVELRTFTDTVDARAFLPPAGARIVDVDRLGTG